MRSNLANLERKKVNTLVITDVHGRDIIDGFVRDSVLDAREFAWESQLRFSWDRDLVGGRCWAVFAFRQCSGAPAPA